MDIANPPRMFLKYKKMIAYAIKFNFSTRMLVFLRFQLVKDLILIWLGIILPSVHYGQLKYSG